MRIGSGVLEVFIKKRKLHLLVGVSKEWSRILNVQDDAQRSGFVRPEGRWVPAWQNEH